MAKFTTRKILFTNKAEDGYTIVTVNANRTKSALAQLFMNIVGAYEIGFGESFWDIENAIPKKERTWKHNLNQNIYRETLAYHENYNPKTIPDNVFHFISAENVAQYDEKEFACYGNIVTTLDINDNFNKYAISTDNWNIVLNESKCVT